jgi:hypothetical protein
MMNWLLYVVLVCAITLCGPQAVYCFDGSASNAVEASQANLDTAARFDVWHAWVSSNLVMQTDRVDRFFGDDILVDETSRTRLKTGIGIRYSDKEGAKIDTDFSLRVALPRIEARWQIFLDELVEEGDFDSLRDLQNPPVGDEPDIGLRYFLRKTTKTSLSTDAGYRIGSPNQAFGRLRGRMRISIARSVLEGTQTFTYFTEEGWRSQSDIAWTRPFGECYGFRSFSRVTMEEKSYGYTPEQRLSLYRTLTRRRAWRVDLDGIWEEVPHPSAISYKLSFTYRQLIHRNWLFLQITPGVEYAKKYDYDANPFVAMAFEIVFNTD